MKVKEIKKVTTHFVLTSRVIKTEEGEQQVNALVASEKSPTLRLSHYSVGTDYITECFDILFTRKTDGYAAADFLEQVINEYYQSTGSETRVASDDPSYSQFMRVPATRVWLVRPKNKSKAVFIYVPPAYNRKTECPDVSTTFRVENRIDDVRLEKLLAL